MSLSSPVTAAPVANSDKRTFSPDAVDNFEEAGLNPAMVESLVLKFLLNIGMASGRRIAAELGLPFGPFPEFLRQLKNQQIVAYANSASANDYVYSLTDTGRACAKMYHRRMHLRRARPRSRSKTISKSVAAQTITTEHPKEDDLRRAFSDLLISEETFRMLGPAINSGRGLFLYGYPGNGKTSIAERITRCFGSTRLDSQGPLRRGPDHQALRHGQPRADRRSSNPAGLLDDTDHDRRWVQIRRPTIVAGGELRMEDLEIHYDPVTKISEAPLQLKSNLGTFLIDDFGRQRMQPIELLNRWIVPLEKRYDFLSLANGKKIRVPFDQLILFSTNLEPKQAGGRGLPPPHSVQDPRDRSDRGDVPQDDRRSSPQARIPGGRSRSRGLPDRASLQAVGRPFRCCQPRDLLLQVRNYCIYNDLPLELKPEYFDFAAMNYFTVM